MTDRTYHGRLDYARDAGMCYGSCHFLRRGNVKAQVEHFLASCGQTIASWSRSMMRTEASRSMPRRNRCPWCRRNSVASRFYTADPDQGAARQPARFRSRQDSSVAVALFVQSAWPSAWAKPWLIQYTGDGVGPGPHDVPGIRIPGGSGIDINHYDGTEEQLRAEWAAGDVPGMPDVRAVSSRRS